MMLPTGRAMRLLLRVLIVTMLMAQHAEAQRGIPKATLFQLKNATTFLKVGQHPRITTGSGFLVNRRGETGLVVTNSHVVTIGPKVADPVEVVLFSGTARARSVLGTVVGLDRDADLAVLCIEAAGLPKPVSLNRKPRVQETKPVYILGFPFGEALSTTEGSPAVTVGQGSVSSIRHDTYGNISVVQIDGDLNPGNSGGPIVDGKGTLVGVAAASVTGTQIGFAIPLQKLNELLMGRPARTTFEEVYNREGTVKFQARCTLIDPLERLRSVSVLLVPRDTVKAKITPQADGSWSRLTSKMVEHKLSVAGNLATSDVRLEGRVDEEVTYLFQMKYMPERRGARYTAPEELVVFFSAGAEVADVAADTGYDWLGSADQKRQRDIVKRETPIATGSQLKGRRYIVDDLRITQIELGKIVSSLQWSSDGRFAYLLEPHGILHKVSVPDFQEQYQFVIPHEVAGLTRSSEGLLALLHKLGEVWIFDESTLELKRKISTGPLRAIACAEGQAVAFGLHPQHQSEITVIDLHAGEVARRLDAADIARRAGRRITRHGQGGAMNRIEDLSMTRDGRYLFCHSGGCLHRLRIKGRDLVYEEGGAQMSSPQFPIILSPDSRYVAAPCGRNAHISGHEDLKANGMYLYKVTDLQTPIVAASPNLRCNVVGFDRVESQLYVGGNGLLVALLPDGTKRKEYRLPLGGTQPPRRISMHPDGRAMLYETGGRPLWIQCPDQPGQAVIEANDPLKGKSELLEGATRTPILLPTGSVLPSMLWSEDAAFVYLLERTGVVRKISVPGFVEQRATDLQCKSKQAVLSREGLLVASEGSDLFLLDAETLQTVRTIRLGEVEGIASCPKVSVAFAVRRTGLRNGSELAVLDLATGEVVKRYRLSELEELAIASNPRQRNAEWLSACVMPVVTADGRHLLCCAHGCMHRLRIDGADLVHEESCGTRMASNCTKGAVSVDSARIGLGVSRNQIVGLGLPLGVSGVYVFDMFDLESTMHALVVDTAPRVLTINDTAGLLYSAHKPEVREGAYRIDLYDIRDGRKLTSVQFADPEAHIRQILAHPADRNALILSDKDLSWVEFR